MSMTSATDDPSLEMLRHGKIDLALHHLRSGPAGRRRPHAAAAPRSRRIVTRFGAAGARPAGRARSPRWTSPGTAGRRCRTGGGYTAELLLADADVALGALTGDDPARPVTVVGSGPRRLHRVAVGRQPARSRARCDPHRRAWPRRWADRADVAELLLALTTDGSTPDPYALVELGRDLRPPDYAASFVRLALSGSPLDEPIAVCAVIRPEWLDRRRQRARRDERPPRRSPRRLRPT